MLQRSAGPRDFTIDSASSPSDDSRTPSPKETTPRPDNIIKSTLCSNIDPALSGAISPSAHSEGGDSARDRAEELWIENIRVIEALKKMISDRLDKGEYDEDEEMSDAKSTIPEPSSESLYPVLRADDD